MGAAIYAFVAVFGVVLMGIVATVSGHFGVALAAVILGIPAIAAPWLIEMTANKKFMRSRLHHWPRLAAARGSVAGRTIGR